MSHLVHLVFYGNTGLTVLLLLGKVQRGFYIAELLSLAKNLYAQLICLFDNLCELTCIKSPKALVGAVRRHHKLLISAGTLY